MRVLVIGGNGFIGQRVVAALLDADAFAVGVASRRAVDGGGAVQSLRVDAADTQRLRGVLADFDAVVNCITGDAATIVGTARSLVAALQGTDCRRLVHMSSMDAFGECSGVIDDETPLAGGGGWYAEAKREAEQVILAAATAPLAVAVLRPGCVFGPASPLWVRRVGDWLKQGRLGDLGPAGDGWSNLVHVDDVARAAVSVLRCLHQGQQALHVNLVAPDSPRWNDYLVAMGCAIGATPVRRIPGWELQIEARVAAAPLRAWERLAPRLGVPDRWAPPAIPPSLLTLMQRDRRLRSRCATENLRLAWTPFSKGVADSAAWYVADRSR